MTLKDLTGRITLRGKATPATPGVGGPVPLGFDSGLIRLVADDGSAANVMWSARITAAAINNVGTLNLATRGFVQTTGAPTISGTSAKDFEGVTVPTADQLFMLVIAAGATNGGNVTVASASPHLPDITLLPGQLAPVRFDSVNGNELSLAADNTIAFTFAAAGSTVDVHLVAIDVP